MDAGDEIVEGYMDGFADDRPGVPSSFANRSDAYVFGWLNGRDDRLRRPRATADELRRQAAALKANVPPSLTASAG